MIKKSTELNINTFLKGYRLPDNIISAYLHLIIIRAKINFGKEYDFLWIMNINHYILFGLSLLGM